jgi:SulP family sulfate permease
MSAKRSEHASKANSPAASAEREILERSGQQTLLINLAGPVTFGAANHLYRRLANVAAYRAIVLDFSEVPHIDESGIIALENIIRSARGNDQLVLVAGLQREIARSIVRFGLSPLFKACPRFSNRLEALETAAEHHREN